MLDLIVLSNNVCVGLGAEDVLDLEGFQVFDNSRRLVHSDRCWHAKVLDVTPHVDSLLTPGETKTEVKSGTDLIKVLVFLEGNFLRREAGLI